MKLFAMAIALVAIPSLASAQSKSACMYTAENGSIKQVNSIEQVPEQFRSTVKCIALKDKALPIPPEKKSTPTSNRVGEISFTRRIFRELQILSGEERVPTERTGPERVRDRNRVEPAVGEALIPQAQLQPSQPGSLARPEEITLDGTVRREYIASPIGNIELRWPRKVESLFGRTPSRAMTEAARTVSKIVSKSAFPPELRRLKAEWKIVFMDAELPSIQIPAELIQNCHPGWMTPPANIYIVAQRVAGGCGGQTAPTRVADSKLAEVLVHEMGHAVEFHLLRQAFGGDRMRAEGFATWFTDYAVEYSSLLPKSETRDMYEKWAKEAIRQSPGYFNFSGSAHDYARASMYFKTIVDRRGLDTLLDIYKAMASEGTPFFAAVEKRTGWSPSQLNEEVNKLLKVSR